MEPYIGVVFYIIFFFWEVILLARYLKIICEKTYTPQIKTEKEELRMEYSPEEIAHILSIEKANYFSDSMAKVNSAIVLQLFQSGALKTKIEDNNHIKYLTVGKQKDLEFAKQEVLNLFQEADKKMKKGTNLQINQMKWKVFGYQKVRNTSNKINKELIEKLNQKKFLNKTAFENIERISKEIFLNFILLFVIYGVTYLTFIPTMVGMLIALFFAICNMIFGFWAKKRISRFTKKGVDEIEKIKMFGEALIESINEAKGETKFQMIEEYYPYAYALGIQKEFMQGSCERIPKKDYPYAYLLQRTNFLREIQEIEKTNAFKLRKIY